jgi:hypothetical protein
MSNCLCIGACVCLSASVLYFLHTHFMQFFIENEKSCTPFIVSVKDNTENCKNVESDKIEQTV